MKLTPQWIAVVPIDTTKHRSIDDDMKLIIAGGRHYNMTEQDIAKLDQIEITEVVSGCASGVDLAGENYANRLGLKITRFPAYWKTHGRSAGPIRNRQMAEYADAVALFPGGKGTESMFREAKKAGIRIFDFRGNNTPID